MDTITDADAWSAFQRRDRAFDGRFVVGVTSTGIYCRPSCAARRPKRENTLLLADGEAARALGLRACRRCRPDDVARDVEAMERAVASIEETHGPLPLSVLAAAVGYSPFHLQRLFVRSIGVSPAAYARAVRARRTLVALATQSSMTEAIGTAGYESAAPFYSDAKDRLGMTPTAWRKGADGIVIRWALVDTTLGALLVAATDRGLCRVAFDSGEAELRERFPAAELVRDDAALAELATRTAKAVDRPGLPHTLPLDVRGTVFQERVWQELARVPPGETLSYAALAARAGRPGAARAAGTACGANPVAVIVPCHRARRGDGTPGGYAWGLERKAELLRREQEA